MKIIFITPQPPELYGGGGNLILSHLLAFIHLFGKENILYFGPEPKSLRIDVRKCIFLRATKKYQKYKNLISQNNYTRLGILAESDYYWEDINGFSDFVWIEFTKTGHLIKKLKSAGKKIYCFAHNVESIYYKDSEPKIFRLFKKSIYENEYLSLLYSDKILGAENYLMNLIRYYQLTCREKLIIFPPFIHINYLKKYTRNHIDDYFVISGSFKYKHNYNYLLGLLKAWSMLNKKEDTFLCIIGSDLYKCLRSLNNMDNIKNIGIYNNPISELSLIRRSVALLNPTISKSGILIKNIIALSQGVPIIGFKESFDGYDISNKNAFFVVRSYSEMIETAFYLLENKNMLVTISKDIIELFNEKYSLEAGIKIMRNIL